MQTDATVGIEPIPIDAERLAFDGDAGQNDESHLSDGVHGFSGLCPIRRPAHVGRSTDANSMFCSGPPHGLTWVIPHWLDSGEPERVE